MIKKEYKMMQKPLWMWALFVAVVLILLVIDLGIFHNKQRNIGVKESLWMSGFYIMMSTLFGLWIWYELGINSFAEYYTGFLVEKSLALDNVFLISLVFSSLSIPNLYQHRVLFWGILGVIVLRALMIGLGAQLIAHFEWVLYLFAIFMIFTGVKMLILPNHEEVSIEDNPLLRWMRKHLNITNKLHKQKFFIKNIDSQTGKSKIFITPLCVALILIEFIDLIFAVDSVPAIFAITSDPYIVYTSNIFAILGLRSLYFALAVVIKRFHYLKHALAIVLLFIGSKIFIADFMGMAKFPPLVSLGITLSILTVGCLYSLYRNNGEVN